MFPRFGLNFDSLRNKEVLRGIEKIYLDAYRDKA